MATNNDVEEFLSHYGVKGMKWGVRNDRKSKYFQKSTKEERAKTRRSKSAKEGQRFIGSLVGVAISSAIISQASNRFIKKRFGTTTAALSRPAASAVIYAGGAYIIRELNPSVFKEQQNNKQIEKDLKKIK